MHPMLIVFPLGLLSTAAIFDIVFFITENQTFALVAYWLIPAGLIGGLFAAVAGMIDWLAVPPNTRAKSVGLLHGVLNAVVLVVFFISWYLRPEPGSTPGMLPQLLSVAGVLLALPGGWLGGELVERLGIGLHPGANPDAPNSLVTDSTTPEKKDNET